MLSDFAYFLADIFLIGRHGMSTLMGISTFAMLKHIDLRACPFTKGCQLSMVSLKQTGKSIPKSSRKMSLGSLGITLGDT